MSWTSKAGLAFLVGFVLGPFGILYAFQRQTISKRCLACKTPVHADASLCPDCQKTSAADMEKGNDREKLIGKRVASNLQ